ncbi:MAG: hypothetical protein H6835_04495 [Planctomycetes bacterium]|nr:hypothetical protein [Planctomycetota bacterium]
MRLSHSISFLPLAFGAALTAQRVVTIDVNNGPGTDHTSLAPAFAALQDGDILIVRAGTYAGLQVSTPWDFVMIGEGNPLVQPPTVGAPEAMRITLSGSYDQRVAIRGMVFESQSTGQWALDLRSYYGSWPAPVVQMEDCDLHSDSPDNDRIALVVDNLGFTAQRCTMNTTQVIDSLVSIVECTIQGIDQSYSGSFSQFAQVALDVIRSEVWIVDSTLRAGNSNFVSGSPASCLGTKDSSTTIYSKVHVAGNSLLQADQQPALNWPTPYVFVNYASYYPAFAQIDYEPTVSLVSSPGGVLAGAGLVLTQQTVPSLAATAAPLGGAWGCTVHGDPGDLAIQLVSTTVHSQVVLGMPTLIDLAAMQFAGVGAIDATGQFAFASIAVPNDPALRTVGLQSTAVLLTPSGALRGTNPVAGQIY